MEVRYLVGDFDDCLFSSVSERPDKLSQQMIDKGRTGGYSGFYGCTHRCYCNLTYCLAEDYYNAGLTTSIYDFYAIYNNYPTYKVAEQYEANTGLPMMALSMLDDMAHGVCGKSFEEVIKPYERDGIIPESDDLYLSLCNALSLATTKNHQLLQIAKHATAKHPDKNIVLDFFDDSENTCDKARTAMDDENWPENVSLNVFNYKNGVITKIYPDDVYYNAIDCTVINTSCLAANSIFSPADNNRKPAANCDIKPITPR